jgi:hypothetical protein
MTSATGRLARFADRHRRWRLLLWKLRLIPEGIGPFYSEDKS